MKVSTRRSGGSVGAGGYSFQGRVTAWYTVKLLAEQSADPGLRLPADTTFKAVHCEAATEVDDLIVETSRGNIYVQAKRSLNLSPALNSEFYSAVSQFTRQHLRNTTSGDQAAARAAHSRYFLAVSDAAPNTIRIHLRDVLGEVRLADPRAPLEELRVSQEMRSALTSIKACILAAWRSAQDRQDKPDESFYREVLELIYVQEFRLSEGGADESRAKETLLEVILYDPAQADAAWSVLLQFCQNLIVAQGSANRQRLQEVLQQSSFRLKAAERHSQHLRHQADRPPSTVFFDESVSHRLSLAR